MSILFYSVSFLMSLNVLNSEAKIQKDRIKSDIFDILTADVQNTENVKRLIKKTELSLLNALWSDELVMDNKTKKQISDVEAKLGNTWPLYTELVAKRLAEWWTDGTGGKVAAAQALIVAGGNNHAIAWYRQEKAEAYTNWKKYDSLITAMWTGIWSDSENRKLEYASLKLLTEAFVDVDDLLIQRPWTINMSTNTNWDVRVQFLWVFDPKMKLQSKLLNSDASEAEKLWPKKYKLKLKNKDGILNTYVIDGLELLSKADGTDLKLKFHTWLKIYEQDGKTLAGDIDFSQNISLWLKNIISHDDLDQKVSHSKMLQFKLKPDISTDIQKRSAFDTLNVAPANHITRGLELSYDKFFKQMEETAFLEIFQWLWMPSIDWLSDEEKKSLIKFIKSKITVLNSAKIDVADTNSFWNEYMKKKKEQWRYLYSEADYTWYLLSNINEDMKLYMKDYVKNKLKGQDLNIKKELPEFFADTLVSWSDDHVERKKTSRFMKSHINTKLSKDLKKDNYLKFLVGENHELSNQKVILDKNKEIWYDMGLSVLSPNSFQLKLKIGGKEQILLWNSHFSLIDNVLNSYDIPEGKVRLHIAYNIYKSMISMTEKAGMSLTTKRGNIRKTLSLSGNNIVLSKSRLKADRTSTNTMVFDEAEFQKTNDMKQLSGGLKDAAIFYHDIMQENYISFRNSTKWKFLGNRYTQTRLPSSWLFSPIKKLLNSNKSLDFNFEKIVTIWEDSIQIKFEKNKFTLVHWEKKYSSFDLAKILNKSVFRGMERKLFGEIYQELINKLRGNSKIKNKDFYVVDPIKAKTYIINKDWKVGYINQENKEIISRNGQKKWRGVVKNTSYSMTMLTNINELYQDPYLMSLLVKTMNEELRSIR